MSICWHVRTDMISFINPIISHSFELQFNYSKPLHIYLFHHLSMDAHVLTILIYIPISLFEVKAQISKGYISIFSLCFSSDCNLIIYLKDKHSSINHNVSHAFLISPSFNNGAFWAFSFETVQCHHLSFDSGE